MTTDRPDTRRQPGTTGIKAPLSGPWFETDSGHPQLIVGALGHSLVEVAVENPRELSRLLAAK